MSFIYVFGALLTAYFVQIAMGMKQIKHFNQNYQELRQLESRDWSTCREVKAGTIILFAVDSQGKILAARKMQGVTVLAKFHPLPQYVNEDIHYMDHYHPLVQKENKLTQQAMENAREIYLRVELGNYQETQPLTPLNGPKFNGNYGKIKYKQN